MPHSWWEGGRGGFTPDQFDQVRRAGTEVLTTRRESNPGNKRLLSDWLAFLERGLLPHELPLFVEFLPVILDCLARGEHPIVYALQWWARQGEAPHDSLATDFNPSILGQITPDKARNPDH